LEPVVGLEPTTFWLQSSCSSQIELHRPKSAAALLVPLPRFPGALLAVWVQTPGNAQRGQTCAMAMGANQRSAAALAVVVLVVIMFAVRFMAFNLDGPACQGPARHDYNGLRGKSRRFFLPPFCLFVDGLPGLYD
jgi:hypothetical protein